MMRFLFNAFLFAVCFGLALSGGNQLDAQSFFDRSERGNFYSKSTPPTRAERAAAEPGRLHRVGNTDVVYNSETSELRSPDVSFNRETEEIKAWDYNPTTEKYVEQPLTRNEFSGVVRGEEVYYDPRSGILRTPDIRFNRVTGNLRVTTRNPYTDVYYFQRFDVDKFEDED